MQDDIKRPPASQKPRPDNPEPAAADELQQQQPVVFNAVPRSLKRTFFQVAVVVVVLAGGGYGAWAAFYHPKTAPTVASAAIRGSVNSQPSQLQLDPSKNYGNKYASGKLPVGDGKYVASGAKQGYVYACSQQAQNLASSNGGAMVRGPWFSSDGKTYDINKKTHVQGSKMWTADFSIKLINGKRVIVTNDLPSHPTGNFPIAGTDPAYAYDRNPNSIKGQTFTFDLSASPTYNSTPSCIGGTVGIMTTGAELFSAFDAGGRDAGAWEVQDDCGGHPQEQGVYHYHTLSRCIKDVSVSTVIGYALDGFPITGPELSKNNVLTSSDLDQCHGITSQINQDGKKVTMYHYVMTEDFPYSVSCYRGTAIQPPGLQQQSQQQGQAPSQNPAGSQPKPRPVPAQ